MQQARNPYRSPLHRNAVKSKGNGYKNNTHKDPQSSASQKRRIYPAPPPPPAPDTPASLLKYNVTDIIWGIGNQSADNNSYEKNVSFIMPENPLGKTYKYKTELIKIINNDVIIIKSTVVDWTPSESTTILNDGLEFSTEYTFKVYLVNSDNTEVLTEGVAPSESFTTPSQISYTRTNINYWFE